jgi:hypothetical protein
MGIKLDKNEGKQFGPDPTAYSIKNFEIGADQAQKWSFGSPGKRSQANKSLGPGPGAYASRSMAFTNPKFYLGNKIEKRPIDDNPGAGQYNPNYS